MIATLPAMSVTDALTQASRYGVTLIGTEYHTHALGGAWSYTFEGSASKLQKLVNYYYYI